jgi:hypothetical protein
MQKMLRARVGRELSVDEICDCPEVLVDYMAQDLISAKQLKDVSANSVEVSGDEKSAKTLEKYGCRFRKKGIVQMSTQTFTLHLSPTVMNLTL